MIVIGFSLKNGGYFWYPFVRTFDEEPFKNKVLNSHIYFIHMRFLFILQLKFGRLYFFGKTKQHSQRIQMNWIQPFSLHHLCFGINTSANLKVEYCHNRFRHDYWYNGFKKKDPHRWISNIIFLYYIVVSWDLQSNLSLLLIPL